MSRERRQNFRVEWNSSATIYDVERQSTYPCVLSDFSNGGAKITGVAVDAIPDEFMLRIARGRLGTRKCRVLWRTADMLGVEFADRIESFADATSVGRRLERRTREPSAKRHGSLSPA